MSRALRVTHPCCPQGHRASPQTHSIPQKTSFPQKTASPSCCGKGRECTRTQPQLLGLSARGFPQTSLPAQQEPHPGCARAELCHPSPRPPADLSLPQGVEDAAGKCFNSNHPLIYFLNCIIAADISAHVWFYYIFVVILQALNFGPQLSWQSAPKTSVLSYSPCRRHHTQGDLFATEKILTLDPKRRVNIYSSRFSTDPTPGPNRAQPSSFREQHSWRLRSCHHPVSPQLLPAAILR